ncbi:MAG TPA: 2OG-Fe(II) oxygenase [bacterium]|nr:2OG-Fe(II) oxygenase [bacterium]
MDAPQPLAPTIARRVEGLDWAALDTALEEQGHALTPPLLTPTECAALVALDGDDQAFRKRIDMEPRRFGRGQYGYFARPLPALVEALRGALYPRLVTVANRWAARLAKAGAGHAAQANDKPAFPFTLEAFLARCHAAGQTRPTPLLLHYAAGGYNCLHQDLYGPLACPLQATLFLSRPGADYGGGEFLLVEQRPRQQSRGTALRPEQGQALLFPSAVRPVPSTRGFARAQVRHGVSTVSHGVRYTLGIIFHDAA